MHTHTHTSILLPICLFLSHIHVSGVEWFLDADRNGTITLDWACHSEVGCVYEGRRWTYTTTYVPVEVENAKCSCVERARTRKQRTAGIKQAMLRAPATVLSNENYQRLKKNKSRRRWDQSSWLPPQADWLNALCMQTMSGPGARTRWRAQRPGKRYYSFQCLWR